MKAIAIILLCCSSCFGGSLTVVNLTGSASLQGSDSFPVGTTVLPTDAAFSASVLESNLPGIVGDEDWDNEHYTLLITVSSPGYGFYHNPRRNLWGAYSAGLGVGFMFFGFGWIYRLTKKIPTGSDF